MDRPRPSPVAALVRRARTDAGLTQAALAQATSIAQPNISDYESGKRSPTVRTLVTLVQACGFELTLRPVADHAAPETGTTRARHGV